MFDDATNPPDATYEVIKPLKNTSYTVGSQVHGYYTVAGNITLGIFIGKENPREWRVLDSEEITKLIEEKYLKKIA